MDWLQVFDPLLEALDKFCKLCPDIEALDADDIAWPGVLTCRSTHTSHKNYDDLPLIRKADLENHNLDGGLWVVINNKVYDIQDFRSVPTSLKDFKIYNRFVFCRCENTNMMELLQKYAGKDASHVFNNTPHSLSSLQMMENYVVGNYCQPEPELPQAPLDCLGICSMLIDTERHLGYLLGLHVHYMCRSLPLQQPEIACKNYMNASFLFGGLQVRFIIFAYKITNLILSRWYNPLILSKKKKVNREAPTLQLEIHRLNQE